MYYDGDYIRSRICGRDHRPYFATGRGRARRLGGGESGMMGLKGFRRFVTSGRWSLRPTAVSAARVTSSVRVRYVRPVIFTPVIIYIHFTFSQRREWCKEA